MSSEEPKKVFISYARAADYSLIELLKGWKDVERPNRWQIVYDEKYLIPGDSIDAFEKQLGGADNVIILLSRKYFKSMDCMIELQYLYQKGATKLLPMVVFVGENGVRDIDESEIIKFWQGVRDTNEDEVAATTKWDEIVQQLPLLFAWLLGEFDRETDRYETFFPVMNKRDPALCRGVFTALDREKKLRYTFLSGSEKKVRIKNKIDRAIGRVPGEVVSKYLASFADELGCKKKDLAIFLTKESDAGHIETVLEILDPWLEDLAEYEETSNELVFLAKVVKEMLGWFLLMAFDDRKLHILTHRLNIKGVNANLELVKESESSLQILTSALVVLPAIFSLQQTDGNVPHLTGKGELVLNEGGIGARNRTEQVERAFDWNNLYTKLQKQNEKLGGLYGTDDALEGSLRVEFKRNAFYLILEETLLKHLDVEQELCHALGKKFPELTQIVLPESDKKEGVGLYLIDGLNIGALDRYIRNIYAHIEVMTQ